ncbi:unnamed protein product [Durusdinium trenchii]|uniref:Uncharacterized protein n=1 Tax=Durusdinium trenchii TaxID=1381693 RepID=A0ABP0JAA5_9DINO
MRSANSSVLQQLCGSVPKETMQSMLPVFFREVSYRQFIDVLVPLLEDVQLLPQVSAMLMSLGASAAMLVVLNRAPKGKLSIVLKAPVEVLVPAVAAMTPGSAEEVLVPVLQEPDELLAETLVPLLGLVKEPERMAMVVNQVDARVLVPILRGVKPQALADILNGLSKEDLAPEGPAGQLLQQLGSDPGLTETKVVPLMALAAPATMVRLVQGIPAEKLLKVLESLEIEGILRLLENTNADFVVRLFNGPLDSVVQTMAGSVADVLADRTIAELVKHSTNTLQAGLAKADDVLARGQQARGAEGDGYKFGDFTVGLISMAVGQESLERGRELMEQHMEKAKQHSKPIQEGWEALQKDVAEKTESIQQNLHESLGQNALKIQAGLARGREKLSTLSCSSGTAYTKGLQEEEVFDFPEPR